MLIPLAKSVLIPLGLTAAASTKDASIQKNWSVKKGVSEIIQNEVKGKKGEIISMLLSTLAADILENMLASKPKPLGREVIRAGEGTIRTNQDF